MKTASDSMLDEVGRTTLQLAEQNHITLEKSLSAVNGRTVTLLDNHFFSDPAQYRFWTRIETLGDIRAADAVLDRWSSDGSEYTLYMKNEEGRAPPVDLSYKSAGFKYYRADAGDLPDWGKEALEEGGAGTLRLIPQAFGNPSTVGYVRSILNPENYDETIGLLVVTKLEVLLTRDLVSVLLPEGAATYVFDGRGELLMKAGTQSEALEAVPGAAAGREAGYYFETGGAGSWLYAFSRRSAFDTTLVYKIPLDAITGNRTAYPWALLAVAAVYLAFVLLFVLYLLRLIVKPVLRLVNVTKIYEPGQPLHTDGDFRRTDEFGLLYGAFLKMTRRLDQSVQENYVMKIKQKESELAALHSQITPHLLYNTLDSIYWYALDSGNQDVGEMVKDLSKLLRIGLSKGKTVITVGEELEHVGAYCRLQMKRYPNRFQVHWDVDDSLAGYAAPKVILQPLVENAIFHGVSGMDGEGEIWVRTRSAEDGIRLVVEDNGFLPVDPERLNRSLEEETSDKGYGIRNVHRRVRLHFGEGYGLRFASREGVGLVAEIRIPYSDR